MLRMIYSSAPTPGGTSLASRAKKRAYCAIFIEARDLLRSAPGVCETCTSFGQGAALRRGCVKLARVSARVPALRRGVRNSHEFRPGCPLCAGVCETCTAWPRQGYPPRGLAATLLRPCPVLLAERHILRKPFSSDSDDHCAHMIA